ncbi:TetR/AcrR family transcriptional regulator C-terminal domain-containing protein [Nonomuraea mangrovi]|uniref:TetR/AcrR family transcriptional regulator C-terminal domain-containing protein n=1 Tax=Nonomuraea mangrovi TaxID=2316207 RepID=A0ABW4SR89_9ACTN
MPAPDDQPIPSVWARPRKQREQPTLSPESIVAEAIRLLDAEGVENLSMRRLGQRLNAGATSLYRHVANKDELIELVVDEVYGELRVPDPGDPAGWRAAITEGAHSLRAMILRHPWVAAVLGQVGLASLGPNLGRQSGRMLAHFSQAGFQAGEAGQAMDTLIAYVIGMTTSEAAYLSMLARSGKTEQEWIAGLRPLTEQAVRDEPMLSDLYAAMQGEDPAKTRDANFTYGLERVLDGLAARLGSQG